MLFAKRQLTFPLGIMISMLLILGLAISVFFFSHLEARASGGSGFNQPGNVLISDQFNNRVIEVDGNKNIVWSFGSGNPTLCNPGPGTIIGLNDAERVSGGLTILAGTGIPPNTVPGLPNGCVDNRVIVVNQAGHIVWQYGQAGVTGSGPNQLNVPVFAIQLPNRNILVVDQANERVIEIDRFTMKIVFQYGGPKAGLLNNPNSVEQLPNGNFLIADENNNRVIEITRSKHIVFQYKDQLLFAAFASRLPNGDTLITDSGHARIVEINAHKQLVFQYFTNTHAGSNVTPLPTNAVRLKDGDTIIADQFNHRILIINPQKQLVFQYGKLNTPGNGKNELNGPYTAFVIGDYTGQTPPPPVF